MIELKRKSDLFSRAVSSTHFSYDDTKKTPITSASISKTSYSKSSSSPHVSILQLQKILGNQHLKELTLKNQLSTSKETIQRIIDTKTGEEVPVNWDNITEEEFNLIKHNMNENIWKLDDNDLNQLRTTVSRLEYEKNKNNPINPDTWFNQLHAIEQESTKMNIEEDHTNTDEDNEDSDFEADEFDPNQQEIYDDLYTKYQAKVKEKNKKLPGRSVQGDLLEKFSSIYFEDMGITEINANTYMKNIPGIDHIRDDDQFPFTQDKLHMGDTGNMVQVYRAHYADRKNMATKFIKASVDRTKSGTLAQSAIKIENMLNDILKNKDWQNKNVFQNIKDEITQFNQDYDDALDSESDFPSIDNLEDIIDIIADGIGFSVPADVWEAIYLLKEASNLSTHEQISNEEMKAYIRIDMRIADFQTLFDNMSEVANPYHYRSTEKDADYNPE